MRSGKTSLVSRKPGGKGGNSDSLTPAISANGEHVAFSSYASNLTPADSETKYDIFVHGLRTGRTTVVSKNNAGVVANEETLRHRRFRGAVVSSPTNRSRRT